MEFQILGSLEVRNERGVLALGGLKPRAIVAALLLHVNEPMSAERLALALWGEDAPASAVKTVQVYVSRLRKALGDASVLETTPAGYRLRVHEGELDAEQFQRLVDDGRRSLAAGEPVKAAAVLREALNLWRGPPLADLQFEPFAQVEITRLEEQRVAALEARVDADLAAGRHAELVGELQRLVADHPSRERLAGQLMLALYRSGRQTDALTTYREARRTLVETIGAEPGSELRRVHAAILRHDTTLDLAPPASAQLPESQRTAYPHTDALDEPSPFAREDPTEPGHGSLLADAATGSLANNRSALPLPPNPTFGRKHDVGVIRELLGRDDSRLITLTGTGGVGKTRLAIEVARTLQRQFADGVYFVSLAATTRSEHAAAAMAQALQIAPVGGEAPEQALERFLGPKHTLVVLDNLEHLLSGIAFLGLLATSCPNLRIVATSREPLRLIAECCHAVRPLDRTSAVQLFADRAQRAGMESELDELAAKICARLDDLPLAIELAAARLRVLSTDELFRRLQDTPTALGAGPRDAPDRQRTLRTTMQWSFELLDGRERDAFSAFAVFAGGATVDAAERVTGASLEVLESLVAKNLLLRRGRRLGMLETVHQYAAERLAVRPDPGIVHRRHALLYCQLAEQAERGLCGPRRSDWLALVDVEANNVRAALHWALNHDDHTLGLTLASALSDYWLARGLPKEGLAWLDLATDTAGRHPPARVRAKALLARASLHAPARDIEGADAAARREPSKHAACEAEKLYRALDDRPGIASALIQLAHTELHFSEFAAGALHAQEALDIARSTGDDILIAKSLAQLASTMPRSEARPLIDEATTRFRHSGNVGALLETLVQASYYAIAEGAYPTATEMLDEAIKLARPLGEPVTIALIRGNQGLAALFQDDHDGATEAFREEIVIARDRVATSLAAEAMAGLGALAAQRGRLDRAARLCGAFVAHMHGGLEAVDHRLLNEIFGPARARHGHAAWDHAYEEGACMSLEAAIHWCGILRARMLAECHTSGSPPTAVPNGRECDSRHPELSSIRRARGA
jgi:predicted ATPase/DNA-binding SARP family transcriptional activator